MADKEVIEMLKDLKKGQDELFRGQNELFKGQNERDKILNELKKGQEELFKGQKQLFEGQEKLISRVDKIEENQQEMKTEMTKISQTVARIEVEHGEKLEILLDVVTGHTKQISSIKERVEKCEKRLDNHDDKFYVLNSAVQAY
ncbi:hypothetical protein EGR52_02775 [bacterium]|nr:hypothetical protein [bacterium]